MKRNDNHDAKLECQTILSSYRIVFLDDEKVVERFIDRLVVVILDRPQIWFNQRYLLHLKNESEMKK